MANTAPVLIWMSGPDKLCTFFNKGWLDFTGRTLEQELGNGWAEGVHREDFDRCLEIYANSFNARQEFTMEYRLRRFDGEYCWVLDNGVARFEADGTFLGYIGTAIDITERKRAEQDLNAALVEIRGLKERLEEENLYLKEEIFEVKGFDEIVGKSDALKYVLTRVEQVAKTDATVLLQGETGVGKELIARVIHEKSSRSNGPQVKVNCATLPEALVESELFGHEKGAFTGADRQRKGRFELADGGTLLLDEVGELPLGTQVKLLRVLQEGEFERVGGSRTIKVKVRVIAATNRKLHDDVSTGRFRQDLFYRLNVYPLTIPPLRQRREDIPLLVSHYARQIGERLGKSISEVPAQVMREFTEYNWPGNIRELQNVIERAVIVSSDGVLRLPEPLVQTTTAPAGEGEAFKEPMTSFDLGRGRAGAYSSGSGSHRMAYRGTQGCSRYAQTPSVHLEIPHEKTRPDQDLELYVASSEKKFTLADRGMRVEGRVSRGEECRDWSVEGNPNLPSLAPSHSTLISLHSSRLSSFDLRSVSLAFHSSLDAACSLVPRHLSLATRYCFVMAPSDN